MKSSLEDLLDKAYQANGVLNSIIAAKRAGLEKLPASLTTKQGIKLAIGDLTLEKVGETQDYMSIERCTHQMTKTYGYFRCNNTMIYPLRATQSIKPCFESYSRIGTGLECQETTSSTQQTVLRASVQKSIIHRSKAC